jgi:hypothetical protein
MNRRTATTAKPLPLAGRKAALSAMVEKGKITAKQATRIDLREPTAQERAHAETLLPAARRVLAREGDQTT